jgi:hypothetical protein
MPDSAQSIPLFGVGVGTKSTNVSAQMRTNLYVETYNDPDKTQMALFSRPGLLRFGLYDNDGTGPIRGAVADALSTDATIECAWFVQGRTIIGILADGTFNASGVDLLTSSGVVRAAQAGSVGILVDGTTGYYFDISTPASPSCTDLSTYPQAASFPFTTPSVTSIASRIIAVDPAEIGRFRWSAAGDPLTWDALDFATAESAPDPLSAVFEYGGQLLMIGTQTIEFWAPAATGASGQLPFLRVGGANIQWGTTAIDTIRKCNDSVIFLGRNQGGARQVVQLKGYEAQPVSTPDVEADIATETSADLDAAVAMFTVVAGHAFYILNLSDRSWVYDVRTGTWGKWITDASRFGGQWSLPAFGTILVADYRDARVYEFDADTYKDDDNTMTRQVISKHASANLARLSCAEVRIDCETGVANNTVPAPTITLSWSKDGGHTYGVDVTQPLGIVGGYLTCTVWRLLGRARDFVFKVTVTEPVKVVIIGAAAIFRP